MSVRAGFIGFGEVAAVFAPVLLERGASVIATDLLVTQPGGLVRLRQRDATGRVDFVALPELAAGTDWIFSTVTTASSVAVARSIAPHLRAGQSFVDLNASAPAVKQEIAGIIGPTGAHFVEGAILSAVGVTGARTRILIGDAAGAAAAQALAGLGLNTTFYSAEIGRASAFKLLRSVFSKGLEALLLEFLAAGWRAGVQDDLWREVTDLFAQNGFERVANNWIQTHPAAHERRYHEMVQVTAEMRALGIEPVLTAATEAFFERSRRLGLAGMFAGRQPSPLEVIARLGEALTHDANRRGAVPAAETANHNLSAP